MPKKWKGYMTVEASFIMPIVTGICLLILLGGFYLYNRCVMSQNDYLLAFRGSRFTDSGKNYGEVVYGDMKEKLPDKQYVETRLIRQAGFYPFCRVQENKVQTLQGLVKVETAGYGGTLRIKKEAKRLNIAEIIERTRSKK